MPSDGNCFLDVLEHAEFALKSGIDSRCSICAYESSMHDAIIGDNELEKLSQMLSTTTNSNFSINLKSKSLQANLWALKLSFAG